MTTIDKLAGRLLTEFAAIPHEQPTTKVEQLGFAIAHLWETNPYRGEQGSVPFAKAA